MAFVSYGNRVYASIKDLPQYTSINNGDKIIVWNESREGPATVDYSDFIIDLDHTTFSTTINELMTFTSTVQNFVNTVSTDIDNISAKLTTVTDDVNTNIRPRIEVLEYLVAVMMGVPRDAADVNKNAFITDPDSQCLSDLLTKICNKISAHPSQTQVLTQPKFVYNAAPVGGAAATGATSISTTDLVATFTSIAPTVTTTNKDASGKTTGSSVTTIDYN